MKEGLEHDAQARELALGGANSVGHFGLHHEQEIAKVLGNFGELEQERGGDLIGQVRDETQLLVLGVIVF